MAELVMVPQRINDRTGGQAGYETLLKTPAVSVENGQSVNKRNNELLIEISRGRINFPAPRTSDLVAQRLAENIKLILPTQEPERSEFCKSLLESLYQYLLEQQPERKLAAIEEEKTQEEEFYEKHESPIVVDTFLKSIQSIPTQQEESIGVYTEEELDLF